MSGQIARRFRDLLREGRQRRGWTFRDVEAETGISHGYVGSLETGKRLPPKVEVIVPLARVLGLAPYDCLTLAAVEHTAAELARWLRLAGLESQGYALQVRRPDGTIVADVTLDDLVGFLDPGTPAMRAGVAAYLHARYRPDGEPIPE